jgi:hypothetical protein
MTIEDIADTPGISPDSGRLCLPDREDPGLVKHLDALAADHPGPLDLS